MKKTLIVILLFMQTALFSAQLTGRPEIRVHEYKPYQVTFRDNQAQRPIAAWGVLMAVSIVGIVLLGYHLGATQHGYTTVNQ